MKYGQLDLKKAVVTDFETYFSDDYTLRKMRSEEYILDPRFKVHGIGVAYPSGKTDFIVGGDIPRWLKSYRHHSFINHKLTFDALIWKLRYGFVPRFMVDTLFLANSVFGPAELSGGNDLESVAERLGLQPKGRVEPFKGVYDLSPAQHIALAEYAKNDADLTLKTALALLPRISRPDFELWLADHTLRIYINKPLRVRAELCRSSAALVERRMKAHLKAMPPISFKFAWEKSRVKKGQKFKEKHTDTLRVNEEVLASNPKFGQCFTQVLKKHKIKMPLKMGKNGLIPALAKADEGFMSLKSCGNKVVSSLVQARLAKKSGDTQIARLRTLQLCSRLGGFRPYLNYWGAVTGRWTGGSGLNAHNFPNPTRSPDEFEREVAALIRACVVPDKGKVFVATDAANIEARVLAWWAREDELVNAFGDGADVYSDFAGETFGEEVRKPNADDPKPKAIRFKLLRNVGKASVLGLGYSMGAPKFEKNQRCSPDVRAMFESGELTTEKCVAIVKQYRKRYPLIVALWGRVETAFFKARDGAQRMVNGVLFTRSAEGRGVDVTLPSGRVIHYCNVRIGSREDNGRGGTRTQWVHGHGKGKKLYGGLLVENIVQAISRDILAEAVYAMEQAGYPVAYHVHDSVVCHVPKKAAKACLAASIDVLSEAPEWGEGMRLGAEGTIEETFA